MRIPSQFNEDNLYRRKDRGSPRPSLMQSDTRKILHLIVALAFVLLMMQQASRPEIYRSFMGALGMQNEATHHPRIVAETESAESITNIDPAMAAKVADGAVWRRGDFPALFWCLNQSRSPASIGPLGIEAPGIDAPWSDAPWVNTVSLLQQPDVFRNRPVRVAGKVARSQQIEATENAQGISNYWQAWIQPDDGANRPIVVIAEQVSAEVANVGQNATNLNGPSVVVEGFFLKRLIYQSPAGADLAPVIVGRMTRREPAANNEIAATAERTTSDWKILAMFVGATVIAGVLLPALVFWRTATTAQRIRQLRRRRTGAPELVFESIDSVSPSDGHGP